MTPTENIKYYSRSMAPIFLMLMAFAIPTSITLTSIFALLTLICVLLSGNWNEKWSTLLKNPVAISFFILALLFVLGLFYTDATFSQALYDIKKHHPYFLAPFLMLAIPSDIIRKNILNLFLAAVLLTLGLSYLKYFNILNVTPKLPGVSVFYAHITQNTFLAFSAGICAYRFFYYEKFNWAYAILFFLIGFNVFLLSDGRTGYISFALVVVYVSLFRYGWKMLFAAFALIAILFSSAYFLSPHFSERIHQVRQEQHLFEKGKTNTSVGIRLAELKYTLPLIEKKWIIGYGTGGIFNAVATLPPSLVDRSLWASYMETGYLNILLAFGVLGLLIFLSVFALQIFYSFKLPREYRFTMQLFLCIYLISAFANPVFVSFGELNLYAFLSAVLFSALQKSTKV